MHKQAKYSSVLINSLSRARKMHCVHESLYASMFAIKSMKKKRVIFKTTIYKI